MLYNAYQAQFDLMEPFRAGAGFVSSLLQNPALGRLRDFYAVRSLDAGLRVFSNLKLTHHRPSFKIDRVMVGNREVAVTEEAAFSTPFGTLLHLKKDIDAVQPPVLIVSPLSGHFATLLRSTVRTLLADHDVYITDWHNARDVPLSDGRFGFDEYVEHVVTFLERMGPGAHVVAVCQPCVHALAAVSVMAQGNNPAQPRSMTLMAGPIDTRVNPTSVNRLAEGKSIAWFEKNLISKVPLRYRGHGRKVYPGFVQLMAFVSMNLDRHAKSHVDMFNHLAAGDLEKAAYTRDFYEEYFAVLDLTAEFYLETVERVFQKHELAKGELTFQGQKVDPGAIRKTSLFTVEGERDDICSVGQTVAAQDLCTGIRPYRKHHHLQAGVGHYGVFSGSKWEKQIYPRVRNLILASD